MPAVVGHPAERFTIAASRSTRRRSARAGARPRRAGGSRTGWSPRPRSSSGRSCARAAPSRCRGGLRPSRTARSRARRRGRAASITAAAWRSAGPLRAPVAVGCGSDRRPEDPVRVTVLDQRPEHRSRRRGPRTPRIESSRSNGTNASRIDGTSPTARHAPPRSSRWRIDRLALAVVAEPPRLQHGGEPDGVDRGLERREVVDRGERRHGQPDLAEQRLLGQPVLGDLEGARRREQRRPRARRGTACSPTGTFSNS